MNLQYFNYLSCKLVSIICGTASDGQNKLYIHATNNYTPVDSTLYIGQTRNKVYIVRFYARVITYNETVLVITIVYALTACNNFVTGCI